MHVYRRWLVLYMRLVLEECKLVYMSTCASRKPATRNPTLPHLHEAFDLGGSDGDEGGCFAEQVAHPLA